MKKVKRKSPLAPLLQRGGLRAILGGYRLTFLFQTQSQQCAVSVFSFEKNRQQEYGSILEKNTDLASPFVKGGLRGIFYCEILPPLNEEMVA